MIKSGQAVAGEFQITDADGNLQNADSTPTGTLVVHGVDDAASVTITHKATGVYKWACTLPTLTAGQLVSVRIEATVDTVATGGTVWQDTGDTLLPSEIPAATGVPSLYAPTSGTRDVGDNDGGAYTDLAAHDETSMVTGELSGASSVEGDRLTVTIGRSTSSTDEVPTVARVTGFYYGTSGHEITVYAYNYVSDAYERIGTMRSRSGAFDYIFPLDASHHDSNTGEMGLQFLHSTGINGNASHYLSLDWVSFEKISTDTKLASDIAQIAALLQDVDDEVDNIEDIVETYPTASEGTTITPATLGTDGEAIGQVPPYAAIYCYVSSTLHYRYDADADGDYSFVLPDGSTWTLRAVAAGYETTEAEVEL